MSEEVHGKKELEVFYQFIKIAGLPIDPGSVRKTPPFPDITCRYRSGEVVLFEIAQIFENDFAALLGRTRSMEVTLCRFYMGLPSADKKEFYLRFQNALLYFDFSCNATVSGVRKGTDQIFHLLLGLREGFAGEISESGCGFCKNLIKSINCIYNSSFTCPICYF